eukprot:366249-Chlamydomonas_euryale.AAC.7
MGRLEVTHSNCLRRIFGMKLMDRHRLGTVHEQCGTSSLELMVRRRTLQWMGMYCEWMRIASCDRFLIAHQQGQLQNMAAWND